MYFKDIIGQEEIKEHLRNSVKTGVIPHAQLFTEKGEEGLLLWHWHTHDI